MGSSASTVRLLQSRFQGGGRSLPRVGPARSLALSAAEASASAHLAHASRLFSRSQMPEAAAANAKPAEAGPPHVYMHISQLRFSAARGDAAAREELLRLIKEREMAPLYKAVCEQLGTACDQSLLSTMEAANAAELAKLDAAVEDAEKNEGESEIREAFLARAMLHMRLGEKEKALSALDETYTKTVAMGLRLDLVLNQLRVSLFFEDLPKCKGYIEKAKELLEQGGDWERRNRLKVYEAVFFLMTRDLKAASALFLDSVATFTATELLPYNHFIMYAVVTSLLALPRKELKPKVVDAPEILQVIDEIEHASGLISGLYSCQYRRFMRSLVDMVDVLKADRAFSPHARYYYREMRILAYTQFLDSYKSVSLESMAATFGVSPAFLDTELSSFISASRLFCTIDKVGGVVSSTRPDTKNAQYQATIKQGDLLLNRVQKLSRVINL